ncbi:MAG: hypothetical protein L6R40_004744 [Gallowayella cf. fulva]|nr:MAG: hypothetical protein L6R40_004744 [Xanthomendoza cf. fulva]
MPSSEIQRSHSPYLPPSPTRPERASEENTADPAFLLTHDAEGKPKKASKRSRVFGRIKKLVGKVGRAAVRPVKLPANAASARPVDELAIEALGYHQLPEPVRKFGRAAKRPSKEPADDGIELERFSIPYDQLPKRNPPPLMTY